MKIFTQESQTGIVELLRVAKGSTNPEAISSIVLNPKNSVRWLIAKKSKMFAPFHGCSKPLETNSEKV
ncbi:hypothetical protein BH24ACI3_BH24ACI3_05160 [soil metagenome]